MKEIKKTWATHVIAITSEGPWKWINKQSPTVYLLKLDTLLFLNNSTNTHRRPTKPFAMCFYSPVWHFNFCDLLALLSTLIYLDGYVTNGMISPGYRLNISDESFITIWYCLAETENGFIQETPIENKFFEYCLSTNLCKNETPDGQGHTGDSSHWCGSRSLSDTY